MDARTIGHASRRRLTCFYAACSAATRVRSDSTRSATRDQANECARSAPFSAQLRRARPVRQQFADRVGDRQVVGRIDQQPGVLVLDGVERPAHIPGDDRHAARVASR